MLNKEETVEPNAKNVAVYREIQEIQDETSQALRGHGEFTKRSKQLPQKLSASENARISRETENFERIVCSTALTDANREGWVNS